MRGCDLFAFVLLVSSCAHHGRSVEFQGVSREPIAAPDAVQEVSTLPRAAERLGRLFIRCQPVSPGDSFSDLSLLDVDCQEQRLRRLLREAASERGGDVLSELSCEQGSTLSCRATLSRQASVSAPNAPRPAPEDVRGALGGNVWVTYESSGLSGRRNVRKESDVREVATLGPGQLTLGNLETRCEACSELSARDALRIAAGRLGASDVVAVRCASQGASQRCLATPAIWERDEGR